MSALKIVREMDRQLGTIRAALNACEKHVHTSRDTVPGPGGPSALPFTLLEHFAQLDAVGVENRLQAWVDALRDAVQDFFESPHTTPTRRQELLALMGKVSDESSILVTHMRALGSNADGRQRDGGQTNADGRPREGEGRQREGRRVLPDGPRGTVEDARKVSLAALNHPSFPPLAVDIDKSALRISDLLKTMRKQVCLLFL